MDLGWFQSWEVTQNLDMINIMYMYTSKINLICPLVEKKYQGSQLF
jgi:hypothetical protein